MPPTATTIIFTGLLVFRRDPTNEKYSVGILRARDAHEPHYFQIEYGPEGQPLTTIAHEDLEKIIQAGNVNWMLEVEGGSGAGIKAQHNPPGHRKAPQPGEDQDFGWIINIENNEFHKGKLKRKEKALQPVIQLTDGTLIASCKTDSVVTLQDRWAEDFGFIAGGIGLKIDTSQGQQPVLSYLDQSGKKVPVLRLTETDQKSYNVKIYNTPEPGTAIEENHFHLYYDKLFTEVPKKDRFDLRLLRPSVWPPRDRCQEAFAGPPPPTPNPFRCGGILVEGGNPLG